jgi:outer membrane protein TolC
VALEHDVVEAALEDTRLEALGTTFELRALLGLDGDGPLAIRDAMDDPERGPDPADSLRLMAALSRQPEVQLARIADLQSRVDLEEIRRQSAPSVDLSLDAGLAGADLTRLTPEALVLQDPQATFGDRLRQDLGASIAVRLRLPVFDRARPRRLQARTAEREAAQLERRVAGESQERRARLLLAGWRSASRRMGASQIVYERAERNLLKVKSLYSGGATTLLDLLDARRVFEDALARRADARMADRWAQFQVEDLR